MTTDNQAQLIKTRVAPSPTGFPHVGTALQALFDWVYAHRHQGKFVVRIEDTDQKRFVPAAEAAIFEALAWLDLNPDESPGVGGPVGPYRQSERLAIYQQYAQQLVAAGQAYYCFCSPERLAEVREQQRIAHQPPKYDRHCRDLDPAEVAQRLAAGEKAVIRLKVPDQQTIVVQDVLRGEVKFDSSLVDDQVLLKSDGFPTYHLAVVVDDHLMGITHLVRGEEWLPSAPKHILLYQYFNWPLPVFIHTPNLRNPDRTKLSKRKGNTSLWWYREQGYLPTALLNFLALLVWLPKNGQEVFDRQTLLAEFEWPQLNVTGPIFDLQKLNWLNGVYLRKLSAAELKSQLLSWANWVIKAGQDPKIIESAQQLVKWSVEPNFEPALILSQERARTLADLPTLLTIYFGQLPAYDRADLLQNQSPELMSKMLMAADQKLLSLITAQSATWTDSQSWEAAIRQLATEFEVKAKDLFMALRSALTAQKFTPPLFEVMKILGPTVCSARLQAAVKFLQS